MISSMATWLLWVANIHRRLLICCTIITKVIFFLFDCCNCMSSFWSTPSIKHLLLCLSQNSLLSFQFLHLLAILFILISILVYICICSQLIIRNRILAIFQLVLRRCPFFWLLFFSITTSCILILFWFIFIVIVFFILTLLLLSLFVLC